MSWKIHNNATLSGSGLILKGNHNKVVGDNNIVTGNNNVVRGNYCTVAGNYVDVNGDNCKVTGDNADVHGDHCIVRGNSCAVFGEGNAVSGNNCTLNGEPVVWKNVRAETRALISGSGASRARDQDNPSSSLSSRQTQLPDAWAEEPVKATGAQAECSVCMERGACVVAVPCGHNALCVACARKLVSATGRTDTLFACVICRKDVARFVRVFS